MRRAGKFYIAAAVLMVLLLSMLSVLTGCNSSTDQFEDETMSYSNSIYNVRTVNQLTGRNALVDTKTKWLVGGTDLGIPFYNSTTDVMHIAFGDTFDNNVNMTGSWRSNVLANSTDFDLSDGLTIDDFYKNPSGIAKAVIDGHHSDSSREYEVTKIPTGGIEIDGNLYMFYMSVRSWGIPGSWQCNYNGVVKSEDDGKTWERVYDLTWIRSSEGAIASDTLILANENVDRIAEGNIGLQGRAAPYFMQIFPIDGRDGYIYIYGISEGRGAGMKLGRVNKDKFESFDEYEYYTGNEGDAPKFVKGRDGLAAVSGADNGNIMPYSVSEPSVMYNQFLNKWMLVYFTGAQIIYRTADNPWGSWSMPETIITSAEYPGLYGGFVHEKYTSQNGKVFYLILSQWMPTYNTYLIEVTLK